MRVCCNFLLKIAVKKKHTFKIFFLTAFFLKLHYPVLTHADCIRVYICKPLCLKPALIKTMTSRSNNCTTFSGLREEETRAAPSPPSSGHHLPLSLPSRLSTGSLEKKRDREKERRRSLLSQLKLSSAAHERNSTTKRTHQSLQRSKAGQPKAALMSMNRTKPDKPEKPKMAQRLSRDLTCSICLDLFKQPVSLPCDHTFCHSCITGYWSGARSPAPPGQPGTGSSGSCPQCRKVFPGQSYRPNRIVANIVESYSREIGEESAGTPAPTGHAPRCARHREELKLYCEEEHELVCLICCVSQEHRAHALVCVDEAEQKYRNSLNSSVSALQAELNTALQCERETEDEVKKLKEHTADLKQRIEAQFGDLHQVLYQEEKLLQVKLKTEERRELIRLDEHKALLSVEISRLRRALTEIEEKLREHDPYTLLRNIKVLLQRQPLKFEKPTLTPPQLCEGRFAGPLQYRVWKSLKGSIYPVPSSITFNASTANPWLSVTPSLTCVRYQTFNSSARDNPQRFDAALSLLGSQGFTHGCHYWEIEVSSSTVWTVGVARESVSRKGVIKALPANGFWTVSLSYGVQYMAGTWPPTVLSLQEQLERVGVYLDYKRGLVSFYNAESMTHLYTFRDTFAETLYPYFNLGFLDKVHENEPLKVFVPKI